MAYSNIIDPTRYLMQQAQQNPFYNPFSPKPNIAAGVGSSLTGYFQQAQAKKTQQEQQEYERSMKERQMSIYEAEAKREQKRYETEMEEKERKRIAIAEVSKKFPWFQSFVDWGFDPEDLAEKKKRAPILQQREDEAWDLEKRRINQQLNISEEQLKQLKNQLSDPGIDEATKRAIFTKAIQPMLTAENDLVQILNSPDMEKDKEKQMEKFHNVYQNYASLYGLDKPIHFAMLAIYDDISGKKGLENAKDKYNVPSMFKQIDDDYMQGKIDTPEGQRHLNIIQQIVASIGFAKDPMKGAQILTDFAIKESKGVKKPTTPEKAPTQVDITASTLISKAGKDTDEMLAMLRKIDAAEIKAQFGCSKPALIMAIKKQLGK